MNRDYAFRESHSLRRELRELVAFAMKRLATDELRDVHHLVRMYLDARAHRLHRQNAGPTEASR